MEFFAALDNPLSADQIQEQIGLEQLPELCAAIDTLLSWESVESGEIYCLWGQFSVRREEINGGVRFTLPSCPNALAWSITTDNREITIHCTINRRDHDPEFIESIEWFVESWQQGLEALRPHDPKAA